MATILFIDTAASHTHVALSKDDVILSCAIHEVINEQALMLNIIIDQILASNGIVINQIDAIAIDAGPGSYTGLRVGLGTAKGIAYALDKKLLLYNRLNLLLGERDNTFFILKARNGEGFAIAKKDGNIILEPQHLFYETVDWEQYRDLIVLTDDDSLLELKISNIQLIDNTIIDINIWNSWAQKRFNNGNEQDDIAYSEPFYLKNAFTTTPKKTI